MEEPHGYRPRGKRVRMCAGDALPLVLLLTLFYFLLLFHFSLYIPAELRGRTWWAWGLLFLGLQLRIHSLIFFALFPRSQKKPPRRLPARARTQPWYGALWMVLALSLGCAVRALQEGPEESPWLMASVAAGWYAAVWLHAKAAGEAVQGSHDGVSGLLLLARRQREQQARLRLLRRPARLKWHLWGALGFSDFIASALCYASGWGSPLLLAAGTGSWCLTFWVQVGLEQRGCGAAQRLVDGWLLSLMLLFYAFPLTIAGIWGDMWSPWMQRSFYFVLLVIYCCSLLPQWCYFLLGHGSLKRPEAFDFYAPSRVRAVPKVPQHAPLSSDPAATQREVG